MTPMAFSLIFGVIKIHGHDPVQGKQIAANALETEEEAVKILEWMKKEINHAWGTRDTIIPSC